MGLVWGIQIPDRYFELQKTVVYVGEEALVEGTLEPSKTYCEDGIYQIRIFKSQCDIEREDESDKRKEEFKTKIETDFNKRRPFGKFYSPNEANKLAKELAETHQVTTGKWMIFLPWDQVDKFWNLLKHAFIKDDNVLNEQARYIKVYGRERNKQKHVEGSRRKYSAVVSIMTSNWTNEAETMAVGRKIQDLDLSISLFYKPDIYTLLKIDRSNRINIKPHVYKIKRRA